MSKFKIYSELCSITYNVMSPRLGQAAAPAAAPGSAAAAAAPLVSPLLDIFVSKLQPRMVAEGRVVFRAGMWGSRGL